MKRQHLLISLVGLLLGFVLVCFGIFLFLSRYVVSVELTLHALFFNHLKGLSYCGLALLTTGLVFLVALARLNRRQYFLLKMGGVSIEDRLLTHFAQESLQKFFPDQSIDCEVLARTNGKIEILANLPHLAEQQRDHILSEMERVLVLTLRKQCQYTRDFIFNVSFSFKPEF